jgi:hypothetical protein
MTALLSTTGRSHDHDVRSTANGCRSRIKTNSGAAARKYPREHERRSRPTGVASLANRQSRASVLAGWLLAAGPIQKSQTKPAALPDPRTTSIVPQPAGRRGDFSFVPAGLKSGSAAYYVAGAATMQQR